MIILAISLISPLLPRLVRRHVYECYTKWLHLFSLLVWPPMWWHNLLIIWSPLKYDFPMNEISAQDHYFQSNIFWVLDHIRFFIANRLSVWCYNIHLLFFNKTQNFMVSSLLYNFLFCYIYISICQFLSVRHSHTDRRLPYTLQWWCRSPSAS